MRNSNYSDKSSAPVSGLLITTQWLEVLFLAFLVVLISGIVGSNGGVIAFVFKTNYLKFLKLNIQILQILSTIHIQKLKF